MKVILSGSRLYGPLPTKPIAVLNYLQFLSHRQNEPFIAVHGDNPEGLDKLVRRWVELQPFDALPDPAIRSTHQLAYPAKWRMFGKRAGILRNDQMLIEQLPSLDMVVGFPHPTGSGTQDMLERARGAGVPVWEIPWEGVPGRPPAARLIPDMHSTPGAGPETAWAWWC